jgi:hypothetical protein
MPTTVQRSVHSTRKHVLANLLGYSELAFFFAFPILLLIALY